MIKKIIKNQMITFTLNVKKKIPQNIPQNMYKKNIY